MTATKQSFFSKAEEARRLVPDKPENWIEYNKIWNERYDALYTRHIGYVKQNNIS
jgi:hypothetical protein